LFFFFFIALLGEAAFFAEDADYAFFIGGLDAADLATLLDFDAFLLLADFATLWDFDAFLLLAAGEQISHLLI
jgi:hypothetical protein